MEFENLNIGSSSNRFLGSSSSQPLKASCSSIPCPKPHSVNTNLCKINNSINIPRPYYSVQILESIQNYHNHEELPRISLTYSLMTSNNQLFVKKKKDDFQINKEFLRKDFYSKEYGFFGKP